jgi:hypothetical protein
MSSTNTYTKPKYVVYHTTYSGDKLPPNYIGSTSLDKIQQGYKGSVSSVEYKSIWNHEIKTNPHLFCVQIISYHDTRPAATYKELQVQKIFNVVTNPLFVNKSYARANGFFGMNVVGENNPNYNKRHTKHAKLKMSNSKIGKKIKNTDAFKIAAQARKKENSWNQLKDKPNFLKFKSYIDFEQSILNQYKKCFKIPALIAKTLNITEGSVKTLLKHNNLEIVIDPNFTKLINNYGPKWTSYTEYQNDIIKLHNTGLGVCQIAKILDVNMSGVTASLKRLNITPNKVKTGPKPKILL